MKMFYRLRAYHENVFSTWTSLTLFRYFIFTIFIMGVMSFTKTIAEEKKSEMASISKKISFADKNIPAKSKEINYLWKNLVKSQFKDEEIKLFNIRKNKISYALIDINDDKKNDLLAMIVDNAYFCGKMGRGCQFFIFLGGENGRMKEIRSCMNINWQSPMYILSSKSYGLSDIKLDNQTILKFDGRQYCSSLNQQGALIQ